MWRRPRRHMHLLFSTQLAAINSCSNAALSASLAVSLAHFHFAMSDHAQLCKMDSASCRHECLQLVSFKVRTSHDRLIRFTRISTVHLRHSHAARGRAGLGHRLARMT